MKKSGKVKWFNNAKGYGFIEHEEVEADIFVHYSAIQEEGYRTLKEGEEVEFALKKGPKGPPGRECSTAFLGRSGSSRLADSPSQVHIP